MSVGDRTEHSLGQISRRERGYRCNCDFPQAAFPGLSTGRDIKSELKPTAAAKSVADLFAIDGSVSHAEIPGHLPQLGNGFF
jgi:hypothetical protein